MKKLFLNLTILCCISCFAQSEIKITTKKCIPKKGYYLQLANVFDDSRCPEGVQCIWAGEVSVTVNVYKDKKLVEEKDLTFNAANRVENSKWFEKFYSKKIKGFGVMPYPKEGVKVKPKKKYISIVFTD
jgi:hypothetical protein